MTELQKLVKARNSLQIIHAEACNAFSNLPEGTALQELQKLLVTDSDRQLQRINEKIESKENE